MTPVITVVTAVRNGARYIAETIESIRAQTFREWEYIIVDDVSGDATIEIVDNLCRRDSRIHLLRRSKPGGPALAALDAVPYIRGAFVARTDADDVSLPTRFSRQLAFLEAKPELRACASFAQQIDASGHRETKLFQAPLTRNGIKWVLCIRCALVHSTALVERSAWIECYRPEPVLRGYTVFLQQQEKPNAPVMPDVEDYRLWCNLSRREWLGVVDEILVHFRWHAGNLSHYRSEVQRTLSHHVRREHIRQLTGETWTDTELVHLNTAGNGYAGPIGSCLEALRRWQQYWEAEESLQPVERAELAGFTRHRRLRCLCASARRQPLQLVRLASSRIGGAFD